MFELDAGYYYGIGAFETILVQNGTPLFIKEHLQRLNSTLDFLRIKKRITIEEVWGFLKKDKMAEGVLKISVSEQNVLFTTRINPYSYDLYEKGFQLTYSLFRRNETSPLTYHKTLNYAENIMAKQEATQKNYDEALFLNSKGEICEGSCSNIFFVKEGQLYTPSISSGLLPGIIRKHICMTENVVECVITKDDIEKFDECFITNSILGIMKVIKIENHNYGTASCVEVIRNKYNALHNYTQ
ncbi:MAG: putative branched-chain-amino-acid aminotransferase [Herbinix sp.]|jgi:4-amino-4-deoxychorismate lyase|nr:putative branched-chain-amino-acid aminotransferase [Herbinix sp.]